MRKIQSKPGERKIIFAINVTADGFADHTAVIADDELHDFYTNLLSSVDIILFGRKTYELLGSYWPVADKDPNSTRSTLDFAHKINAMPKIVFSQTISGVDWLNTSLIKNNALDEIIKLKKQPGRYISVGGISFASYLLKQELIDEFWFLVQPIILGKGRRLFEGLDINVKLKLEGSQKLNSGVVALHYLNERLLKDNLS